MSYATEIKKELSAARSVLRLYLETPRPSHLPQVREEIRSAALKERIPDKTTQTLMLAATEIISNLFCHPKKAAGFISINLLLNQSEAILDIADNSTPFYEFQAKIENSVKMMAAGPVTGLEAGRGLGLLQKTMSRIKYTAADASLDGNNHFIAATALMIPGLHAQNTAANEKNVVFIVDDDDIFREMTATMLMKKYDVRAFSRAADAIAAFEKETPDLVISDLIMPEMNGIDLRKALSGLKNGDTTPFVFLTGHGEAVEQSYVNQLGIDDFIHKPVRKEHLLDIASRLMSRSRQIRHKIRGEVDENITAVLRPQLPEKFNGWRAELRNIMAEAGGGDFVLFSETPVGSSLILADVMGHGTTAKFFAYAYAGYLRSLFHVNKNMTNPGEFLSRLSSCVENDPFLESQIVTCQALWLTPDGQVTIASAGHPWPQAVRGGKAETVEISGPLPGLMSLAPYHTMTLQLAPGDRLALYTDGFLGRFGAQNDIRVSSNRVRENMQQMASYSPERATDIIWGKFLKQEEKANAPDDATFIILEHNRST